MSQAKKSAPVDCIMACTKCGVLMHSSYYICRSNRPTGARYYPDCRACRREAWNRNTRKRRGGLHGYCKVQRMVAPPEQVAAAVIALAQKASPENEGVKVYRMPDGEIRFWQGGMVAPKVAEKIGLYDFEAKPEYVLEDLQA